MDYGVFCFLNFLFMFLVVLCCYPNNLKMAACPSLSVLPWYKEGFSLFNSTGDSQSSPIFSVVVFFTCLGRLLVREILGFFFLKRGSLQSFAPSGVCLLYHGFSEAAQHIDQVFLFSAANRHLAYASSHQHLSRAGWKPVPRAIP